jgi:Ubiquitin-2 like Rad60 SUMO-like
MDAYRFMYEGRRIDIHNTAEQLEMEDGDLIDVTRVQHGEYFNPSFDE